MKRVMLVLLFALSGFLGIQCGNTEVATKYILNGKEIPTNYYLLGQRFAPYRLFEIEESYGSKYCNIFLDDPRTKYEPDIKIAYRISDRTFDHVTGIDPKVCANWDKLLDSLELVSTSASVSISDKITTPQAAIYLRKSGSKKNFDVALFYDSENWYLTTICCETAKGETVCFFPFSDDGDTTQRYDPR